jgi:arylsulfatase A-like enzyme
MRNGVRLATCWILGLLLIGCGGGDDGRAGPSAAAGGSQGGGGADGGSGSQPPPGEPGDPEDPGPGNGNEDPGGAGGDDVTSGVATGACQPAMDPSRDALLFAWPDSGGTWHVRAFAGGDDARSYAGVITSAAGFEPIETSGDPAVRMESTAGNVASDGDGIHFDLRVPPRSFAGFAFKPAQGSAPVTLTLDSSTGDGLRLGRLRSPVTGAVRLDLAGPCGAVSADGEPAGGADRGALSAWREPGSDSLHDRWHVSFAAGPAAQRVAGVVDADQDISGLSPTGLEGSDVLDGSAPQRLTFDVAAGASPKTFAFEVPKGAHPCLSLDDEGGAAVRIGADGMPMAPPFDLGTLGECPSGQPWSFVLVLTDDQRADTLDPDIMPLLYARLQALGAVDFRDSYVTTPLCCPSRSGFYSGGMYAHRTGFLTIDGPNGSVDLFRDDRTLGRLLHDRGYSTLFVGKYFVTYSDIIYQRDWPYIPPGWTRFIGRASFATSEQWDNFRYTVGSSRGEASGVGTTSRVQEYTTTYEQRQVLDFIDQVKQRPFFIILSTTAPHQPAIPAAEDVGKFADFVHTAPSLGEDVSDKPAWVAQWPAANQADTLSTDFIHRQLESLQAVDRASAAILDKLQALGLLDHTLFVFTSDNGFLWGEHGLWEKGAAYEESARVPLAVVAPHATDLRDDHNLVAANLDVGATIADFGGIDLTANGTEHGSDGVSLRPILDQPGTTLSREDILLESFGDRLGTYGLWAALVQYRGEERWKYIEHPNGDEELYDLAQDPYELDSLAAAETYSTKKVELKAALDSRKALAITTLNTSIPGGVVGEPYRLEVSAWGGMPPYDYRWSTDPAHPLPAGLSLTVDPTDPKKAVISGVPQQTVCRQVSWVTVEDVLPPGAPPETERGGGQRYTSSFKLSMGTRGANGKWVTPCTGAEPAPAAGSESTTG